MESKFIKCKYMEDNYNKVEEVPNLGSVITLDSKGRLINSQFSRPTSSQSLLKLNFTDNIPDADELPNSIISYGDTPNSTNLSYNDHNYIGFEELKNFENYDKKASDYISKQTDNITKVSSANNISNIRISNYHSFNNNFIANNLSDDIFTERLKTNAQKVMINSNVTNTSTPILASRLNPINNNSNTVFGARRPLIGANTIVINPNPISRVPGMNFIKVQQRTSVNDAVNDTNSFDSRIIKLPIKNPPTLTSLISNEQLNENYNNNDKIDLSKSYNLVPRCICGFTHDDGGMIRCEICRTWQHIICMYPDNKFPILYKCEKCDPRDVDYERAIATQTNNLINAGHDVSEFLVQNEINESEIEQDSDKMSKTQPQYLILQSDNKGSYSSSIQASQSIYLNSSGSSHLVPPGSPRTSKRKQDLFGLKSAIVTPTLSPSAATPNPIFKPIQESYKPIHIENSQVNRLTNYHVQTVPNNTTNNAVQFHQNDTQSINQMSSELKKVLEDVVIPHTNLSIHQLQFLKQYNFKIGNSGFDVVLLNFHQHAIKATEEFTSTEVIMEYNGSISLADEVLCDYDYRKQYNPYLLFYEKYNQMSLCINTKDVSTQAMYIRRSCTPNSEIKHRYLQNGQLYFYIVPINHISKDSEITIGFGFDFTECRYQVECACNQPSCQVKMGKSMARTPQTPVISKTLTPPPPSSESHSFGNNYESSFYNTENYDYALGVAPSTQPQPTKRQYRKRGRSSKILCSSDRSTYETSVDDNMGSPIKVRRNKRGRPPLNRSNGIQRSDIHSKHNTIINSENKSENGENIHSNLLMNENIQPSIEIKSNFKNFKRISSSQWSIKAHRKLLKMKKSQRKVNPTKRKVGRPLKNKDKILVQEKGIYAKSHTSETHFSDAYSQEMKEELDEHFISHDQYDHNVSSNSDSKKHDSSRDEGRYWLEEINKKIEKQKLKETKKHRSKNFKKYLDRGEVRKFKDDRNDSYEENVYSVDDDLEDETTVEEVKDINTYNIVDLKMKKSADHLSTKKKKMKKAIKNNSDYILSIKESNIDDLKNDLLLITASLQESEDNDNKVLDSVDMNAKNISSEGISEAKEEHIECEPVNMCDDKVESDILDTHTIEIETENQSIMNEYLNERPSSTNKTKFRKSNDSVSDCNTNKASREERWVNIMWQRILQNEKCDNKQTKRKRNKSSLNDDSSEFKNELMDSKCESDQSDRTSNSKLTTNYNSITHFGSKTKRSVYNYIGHQQPSRDYSSNDDSDALTNDILTKVNAMYDIKNEKGNTLKEDDTKSPVQDQCEFIVYKEQQSNPLEKLSRENSQMFNADSNILSPSNSDKYPHAKKKWLRKALLEENLIDEDCTIQLNKQLEKQKLGQLEFNSISTVDKDPVEEKLAKIENSSKRSFLPPIITNNSIESDNSNIISDNTTINTLHKTTAINPKKRLLNQFSMEDDKNSLQDTYEPLKYSSFTSCESEQLKTKLTLSEYRKRKFFEKPNKNGDNSGTSKTSNDPNLNWSASTLSQVQECEVPAIKSESQTLSPVISEDNNCKLELLTPNDVEESSTAYIEALKQLENITGSHYNNNSFPSHKINKPMSSNNTVIAETKPQVSQADLLRSYLNTLNNLNISNRLDPRINRHLNILDDLSTAATSSSDKLQINNTVKDVLEPEVFNTDNPMSPDPELYQENIDFTSRKTNHNEDYVNQSSQQPSSVGPRTPNDMHDIQPSYPIGTSPVQPSSAHSFISQPTPTSESYLDLEKSGKENKFESITEELIQSLSDWTEHPLIIGKLAGIQEPHLLEEIDDFEDDLSYSVEFCGTKDDGAGNKISIIPPMRSQEELEALMASQKQRDSQIREWQEMRQLERERNKLEHRMRRAFHRNQRTGSASRRPGTGNSSGEHDTALNSRNTTYLSNAVNDEQTMKAFNFHLSTVNDKLMEQINQLKNMKSTVPQNNDKDLPNSYKLDFNGQPLSQEDLVRVESKESKNIKVKVEQNMESEKEFSTENLKPNREGVPRNAENSKFSYNNDPYSNYNQSDSSNSKLDCEVTNERNNELVNNTISDVSQNYYKNTLSSSEITTTSTFMCK